MCLCTYVSMYLCLIISITYVFFRYRHLDTQAQRIGDNRPQRLAFTLPSIIVIGRFSKKLPCSVSAWHLLNTMYQRKDNFYQRAKKEGYASRAAYKLKEIQKRYKILRAGSRVLELGAAPGGWMQVASKEIGPKGKVIAIDKAPLKIAMPRNAEFYRQKAEELLIQKKEWELDVILSDLSPDLSGISFRDIFQSYELALLVWKVAQKYLKKGGALVIKIFPGKETNQLKAEIKRAFESLKTFTPEATRKTSNEVYLIAKGFKRTD